MKSTGIVRQMDQLGRISVPVELRRTFEIEEKDHLEFFVESDRIVIKKYQPGCVFCGEVAFEKALNGKLVCGSCVEKLK